LGAQHNFTFYFTTCWFFHLSLMVLVTFLFENHHQHIYD
jgi:hypothetical protein